MFIEKIRLVYDPNVPIFTKEILKLFPEYSRAYIFKLIKKSEEKGELVKFSPGVYFIPTQIVFGKSSIVADMVVEKKYIQDNDDIYGVYSGLILLNYFSVTTQVPNIIEVVTNKESTRGRMINIDGRKFILKKSIFEINKDNSKIYTILQLFNEIGIKEKINSFSKKTIVSYINDNNISQNELLSYAIKFPPRVINNIVRSDILNEIA